MLEHFDSDTLGLVDFGILHHLAQHGIGILAFALQVKVEGGVVDASAGIGEVAGVHLEPLGQQHDRFLNTVAQSDIAQFGEKGLDSAAEHGHGIGIVEKNRIGAQPLDVRRNIHDGLHGAQIAEEAPYAPGIADGCLNAKFGRNPQLILERIIASHLDGTENTVRAGKRLAPIGGAVNRGRIVPFIHITLHHPACHLQVLGVDIHQPQFAVAECVKGEDIAGQVSGKNKTTGSNENNLPWFHGIHLSCWIL